MCSLHHTEYVYEKVFRTLFKWYGLDEVLYRKHCRRQKGEDSVNKTVYREKYTEDSLYGTVKETNRLVII